MSLVEVKDLYKYFPIHAGLMSRHVGDVKAVDGVNFTIDAGETLGLVGESGSGKTTVLTSRVMRLLLEGVPPQRILCLTFTRAAAAEMSIRVTNQLSFWATCGEDELREGDDGNHGIGSSLAAPLDGRSTPFRQVRQCGGIRRGASDIPAPDRPRSKGIWSTRRAVRAALLYDPYRQAQWRHFAQRHSGPCGNQGGCACVHFR